MIRRPPRSTLFPTRRSSDLQRHLRERDLLGALAGDVLVTHGLHAEVTLGERIHVVPARVTRTDRKSTRLNSSHSQISYAVFCLKKKKTLQRFDRKIPYSPHF